MSGIGNLLRELRGKESLREASKRIGISHTYLDTIEKGYDKRSGKEVSPSPDTLKLISSAYNYPYKKLLILSGYIDDDNEVEDEEKRKATIIDKIKTEFPDADPMFNDLASFTADDMEEVYDYIKYIKSKKDKKGD
ncbi:helix-turn-helix transcriptional regulator [Cytobacillus horneckiae]|uniref:helix-turn-helix domain-containing protein n=1 Tax=Cytobacillus horneckiae TaxID=549687 RepID=UPI002E244C2D|nr:helix-turn-helix transcriptional regulator [Cytobacillus horneckiae]